MTRSVPAGVEPGLRGECERTVTREMTLANVNSDWPAVFSTPWMISMMEIACSNAVRHALPPGSMTVGVRIEIDHLRAVYEGAHVRVVSKLVAIEGRRLIHEVQATSGEEVIGQGRIFHTIVEHARFVAKAAAKLGSR